MSKTVFAIDDTKQKFQLTVPDDGIVIPFITSISNPTAQVDNENRKIILNHNMSYSKIYYSYNKNDLLTPTNGTLYDRSNLNGIVPVIDTSKESGWYSGTIYYVAVVSDVASSIMSVSYSFLPREGEIFNIDEISSYCYYIDDNYVNCIQEDFATLYDLYQELNTFSLNGTNWPDDPPQKYLLGQGALLTQDIIENTESLPEDWENRWDELLDLRSKRSNYWGIITRGDYEKLISLGFSLSNFYEGDMRYFLGYYEGYTSYYYYLDNVNNEYEIKTGDVEYQHSATIMYLSGIIGCFLPISNF